MPELVPGLRAVLEPFAKVADHLAPSLRGKRDTPLWSRGSIDGDALITVGHVEAARAALASLSEAEAGAERVWFCRTTGQSWAKLFSHRCPCGKTDAACGWRVLLPAPEAKEYLT
jgi:hypothetical protein